MLQRKDDVKENIREVFFQWLEKEYERRSAKFSAESTFF